MLSKGTKGPDSGCATWIQVQVIGQVVRNVQVQEAVVVQIGCIDPHALGLQIQSPRFEPGP